MATNNRQFQLKKKKREANESKANDADSEA